MRRLLRAFLTGIVGWALLTAQADAIGWYRWGGSWTSITPIVAYQPGSTKQTTSATYCRQTSSWQNCYTAFTPVVHTHTGITTGTDTVPSGASQVILDCRGRGGPGGSGISTNKAAAGGGGGGRTTRTVVLTPGDWGYGIPFQITGGTGSANMTSVALANYSGTMIATNGATGGTATLTAIGGAAGTGTGGTSNLTGTAGGNSSGTTGGGSGGAGADGSGGGAGGDNLGGPASAGTDPSGGGGGQPYQTPSGPNGTPGLSSSGQCSMSYS